MKFRQLSAVVLICAATHIVAQDDAGSTASVTITNAWGAPDAEPKQASHTSFTPVEKDSGNVTKATADNSTNIATTTLNTTEVNVTIVSTLPPTERPTARPTKKPTAIPTVAPTVAPSAKPTSPTLFPDFVPVPVQDVGDNELPAEVWPLDQCQGGMYFEDDLFFVC